MNIYAKITCAVLAGAVFTGGAVAQNYAIHRDLLYTPVEVGTYDLDRDLLYVHPPVQPEKDDIHRDLLYTPVEAGTYDLDRDLLYQVKDF